MTDTYGGRVGVAIVLAVLLHAGAAAAIAIFGFQLEPYPESTSVTVTLPEYEEPEPEPETETPEAEEPPVRAAQSERTQSDSAQPGPPVEERRQTGRAESAQTAPPQRSAEETPSPSRRSEGDNGTSSAEQSPEDGALSAEARAAAREAQRADFDELSRIDEPDQPDSNLPGWAAAGEILERPATQSPASQEEQAELARQLSSQSPEFANTLRELQRALDQDPAATAPTPSVPGDQSSNEPSPTGEVSGSEFIEWFGGERAALSAEPPELAADDFGGQVPAVVNYMVVFEVDAAGRVVPGSLILTRSSGYTAADQKVRRAVQGWRFQPAPGSPNVTAIATLQILRGEIQ